MLKIKMLLSISLISIDSKNRLSGKEDLRGRDNEVKRRGSTPSFVVTNRFLRNLVPVPVD